MLVFNHAKIIVNCYTVSYFSFPFHKTKRSSLATNILTGECKITLKDDYHPGNEK